MTPDQERRLRSIVKNIVSYDQEEPALQRIFAEIRSMELKAYGIGYRAGAEDASNPQCAEGMGQQR